MAAVTVDELRLEDKTLNLQSVSSFTVSEQLVLDNTNEQITWDNTSLALSGGLKLDTNGELTWKNPGNLAIGNITLNGGVLKIGKTTGSQTFVLDNSTNLTLTGRFRDLFQRWKYTELFGSRGFTGQNTYVRRKRSTTKHQRPQSGSRR